MHSVRQRQTDRQTARWKYRRTDDSIMPIALVRPAKTIKQSWSSCTVLVEKDDIRSPHYWRHNSDDIYVSKLFRIPPELIVDPFLTTHSENALKKFCKTSVTKITRVTRHESDEMFNVRSKTDEQPWTKLNWTYLQLAKQINNKLLCKKSVYKTKKLCKGDIVVLVWGTKTAKITFSPL